MVRPEEVDDGVALSTELSRWPGGRALYDPRPGEPRAWSAVGVTIVGRLDPVDLTVQAGERLLVTGENGAGKSTLLRVLAGDLAPGRGHVNRRGRIGYLPQDPDPGSADETLLTAYARGRGKPKTTPNSS